jgi:hypothetical protein
MASEVTKVSVFDDRIVQTKPKYAVEKGALSLTNSPYNAIAATTSQQTFNLIIPSENVFIDRAVDWTCDLYFKFTLSLVDISGNALSAAPAAGVPLCVVGRDVALAPFPLHQCVNTMSATINDTTAVINTADVLTQVLRLTDYKAHRAQRTCPTMLDKYLNVPPTYNFANSPVHGFEAAHNTDEVPNGAYARWTWTDSTGSPLGASGTITGTGQDVYNYKNGIPVSNGSNYGPFTLYARVTSTEKLVLPPFVFGDAFEGHTGLFGVQNIQLVMNLQNPDRLLRNALQYDDAGLIPGAFTGDSLKSISSVSYNTAPTNGAWQNCKVNVQYLTPALDVPLPPRSIVPYQEFPRYISNAATINAYSATGSTWQNQTLQTQTITLPSIPDLLMIYVKPLTSTLSVRQGDFVCPIKSISVNFDNFSGLLSSHTQEELYKMSIANGLDMDWHTWSGKAVVGVPTGETSVGWTGAPSTGGQYGVAAGGNVFGATGINLPLVGGPLLLKPGRDIVLQAGQASGLVGNFTFQANITFDNFSSATSVNCYIIAVNSGFFETIKGSSRIIKGVLTEQDIISAPSADATTMGALRRMTGAGMMTASGVQMVAGVMDTAAKAPTGRGAGSGGRMGAYTM